MVVKLKQSFEKTRHIKNTDKSEKYILRGQRNARYHEKILSNKKNLIILSIFTKIRIDSVDIFSVNITFDDLRNDVSHFVVA